MDILDIDEHGKNCEKGEGFDVKFEVEGVIGN
jgi:hypothetical protein